MTTFTDAPFDEISSDSVSLSLIRDFADVFREHFGKRIEFSLHYRTSGRTSKFTVDCDEKRITPVAARIFAQDENGLATIYYHDIDDYPAVSGLNPVDEHGQVIGHQVEMVSWMRLTPTRSKASCFLPSITTKLSTSITRCFDQRSVDCLDEFRSDTFQ